MMEKHTPVLFRLQNYKKTDYNIFQIR